ncbi:hypothetical protein KCA1_0106 [Lactiplantibacillus pentosus KCA1]|nr:hypothetical protein KCA1_0106 [Lactiplantibacillus pentosus KCA1]
MDSVKLVREYCCETSAVGGAVATYSEKHFQQRGVRVCNQARMFHVKHLVTQVVSPQQTVTT